MKSISFVVLHYLTSDYTEKCIDSILNLHRYQDYYDVKIVVVDNHSMNGTYEYLKEKYINNMDVSLISLEKNIGFAKANNVGYNFAKYKLKSDFIICTNNDTEFLQKDFVKIMIEYYVKYNFHVGGPNIYSIQEKKNQNPLRNETLSYKDVINIEKNLHSIKNDKLLTYKLCVKKIIPEIFLKMYRELRSKKQNSKNVSGNSRNVADNSIVLHGACVIYSPQFIKKNEYAFNPETFLYFEEDLLAAYCEKKKYSTVYLENLTVNHHEDASTNAIKNNKNELNKIHFKLNHQINSILILKKMIEKSKGCTS